MKSGWFTVVLLGLALLAPAYAQSPAPHAHGAPAAQASSEMYDGQVRRVNKETRRVTLAHGPLKAFNMPPMTMAFPVKDVSQLAPLKEGDKVRFALEQSGDDLVITRIEAVK
jgi:Cu(I)/Ag(I) efflux system periplasmic protein CusF